MYCILCGRSTTSDAYTYNIAQHSASQGSSDGATIVKDAINVCASCNYYFDGTTNGLTQAMLSSNKISGGGRAAPFLYMPKDQMLVWLASCCSGEAGNSLSGWFTRMVALMSGNSTPPY